MTSSYITISEDLMEDMFEISFTVIQHGVPSNTGLFRRTPFEVFEPPITIPCEEFIRDVPLFLRENVANYLSQNNIEPLASEIISYYQEAIQRTAIRTTTYHRLIPLIVYLRVNTTSDRGLVPLFYHLQTTALYADNEYNEYMIYTEIYHPTEPSIIHHQQSSDIDELREINQVLEQSMQQFFIVPATEKAVASLLKKMELSDNEMKTSQCSICLESFDDEDGDDVSALPCDHFFHNDCIVKWLKTGHTCPLCRFQWPVE